eukprot:7743361-Pyramimonas_sp.AAC.1
MLMQNLPTILFFAFLGLRHEDIAESNACGGALVTYSVPPQRLLKIGRGAIVAGLPALRITTMQ